MKYLILFCSSVLFMCNLSVVAQIKYTSEDKELLRNIFTELAEDNHSSASQLVVECGKLLLGKPYVAHTLEGSPEQLRINLREMDCNTYAENCLAIALAIKNGHTTFEGFSKELTHIRYRKGEINGYPSRLHYFSDWIFENEKAGKVKQISKSLANTPYPLKLSFMSQHAQSYSALKHNPNLIPLVAQIEEHISKRKMFYIPKEKVKALNDKFQEGDIIGITTDIAGLDITHVGILVKLNGQTHLMHASSKAEKVIISKQALFNYLEDRDSASGIMVVRPN